MIITVLRNSDGSEEAVGFSSTGLNSTIFDGELLEVVEERQVTYDGDEPELETLLLDRVFFRNVDEEDEIQVTKEVDFHCGNRGEDV